MDKQVKFNQFILKADILAQEYNGLNLGQIYMKVLKDDYTALYEEIEGTELNASIFRENIPALFTFLNRKL